MESFCTPDAKSGQCVTEFNGRNESLATHKPLTPYQIERAKQRAEFDRLLASCNVTPNTKLLHDVPSKQQPAGRRFATI